MSTIEYVDRITPQFIDELNANFQALEDAINTGAADLFKPVSGGLGVQLACSTSSGVTSRQQLVGSGASFWAYNSGDVTAFILFGDSTVVGVAQGLAIPAKVPFTMALPVGATWVAGVTLTGTATVNITLGNGK